MFTPPAPRPVHESQIARIFQLQRDGYVENINGAWVLTDLGWRTLSAAAEPRPKPIKQSKTEIECELRRCQPIIWG
jgi:hypothetical protein